MTLADFSAYSGPFFDKLNQPEDFGDMVEISNKINKKLSGTILKFYLIFCKLVTELCLKK